MSLGAGELIVIFLVLVLLVGSSQVPKLARSLGRAQREFREGLDELRTAGVDGAGSAHGGAGDRAANEAANEADNKVGEGPGGLDAAAGRGDQ